MENDALEAAIQFAKKYLEDLLTFFDLNADIHASHDEHVIELSVPSTHLNGFLIGQRGDTLRSLQFLVSMALRNSEHEYTRVNVDVADYKKQRSEKLAEEAEGWARAVRDSGEERHLQPMSPVDRRTVHQAVGEISGVVTTSEGEGRDRHIVLKPQPEDDTSEDT